MTIQCAAIDFCCEAIPPGGLYFDRFDYVLCADDLNSVTRVIAEVEKLCNAGNYAVGYIAYEAASAFDSALVSHSHNNAMPLAVFAIASEPSARPVSIDGDFGCYTLGQWQPAWSQSEYELAFAHVLEHISRGDSYQVNLTFPLTADFHGDPLACYQTLRNTRCGNYCGCLLGDDFSVISSSPELFFARRGCEINTRPMKGTAPRGYTMAQDNAVARQLCHCEKQRAENLMIVDLLRNDIGRICDSGSVRVASSFDCERYPTLWQMTSSVNGHLADSVKLADIFGAIFPCGSVTGAPKIMTSRIISQLEKGPRGVYCGAFGAILPGGDCVFNVPIRTLQLFRDKARNSSKAVYHVGSGVVADSDPAGEYAECLLKAEVVRRGGSVCDFKLLETILWRPDCGYFLLDEHIERMMDSGDFFNFKTDAMAIRDALEKASATFKGPMRVRLLGDVDGKLEIQSQPFSARQVKEPVKVSLAAVPIDTETPFVYHKTTRREQYDAFRVNVGGIFDVLLFNSRGELTESTIANIAVKLGDIWYTPPVECGLLGGVMRRKLLASGELHEKVLTLADLERASGLRLLNSLRGVLDAELCH